VVVMRVFIPNQKEQHQAKLITRTENSLCLGMQFGTSLKSPPLVKVTAMRFGAIA